jgi:hypothetical protein
VAAAGPLEASDTLTSLEINAGHGVVQAYAFEGQEGGTLSLNSHENKDDARRDDVFATRQRERSPHLAEQANASVIRKRAKLNTNER